MNVKKVVCFILVFLIALSAGNFALAQEEEALRFLDIAESWAKDEITEMAEKGIVSGTGNGLFEPDREITRSEFLILLERILGINPVEYNGAYPDVTENDWYAESLQAAFNLNIIDKEFGESFSGNTPITRIEMASLLSRGCKLFINDTAESADVKYEDASEIPQWAMADVSFVDAYGIMQGNDKGMFEPENNATRAEAAAVIFRTINVLDEAGLISGKMPWRQAPVVYRLSDAIKPGEAFQIYGAGLDSTTKVYIEDIATAGDVPGEQSTEAEVVLFDDYEMYVTAILPENVKPSVYKVWASNEYGIANGLYLNNARPLWVGLSDTAYAGLTVRLVGANFMGESFGAENNTAVKLLSGGAEYPVTITSLEPYCVSVTVPENMPLGEYKIAITNNGRDYVILENEQTLTIVEKGNDPYKLGVAWEKGYVYNNKLNVKDFGAVGDGTADDTEAFKNTLAELDKMGGGIVYIPNGTYRITNITVPAHTIFEGESRNGARLAYAGTDNGTGWFVSDESSLATGYQGFYNLTFCKSPEVTVYQYPSSLFWVGHPWTEETAYSTASHTYEGYFMKSCTFDFPMEMPENVTTHYYGILEKYALIDDINGTGIKICLSPSTADYTTVINTNQSPYSTSNESLGRYSIYENNTINLQSQLRKEDGTPIYAQGVFLRSQAYMAHNTIKNTGTPTAPQNDGEIMCTENSNGGTVRCAGYVSGATENSVSGTVKLNADGTVAAYNLNAYNERVPRWGEYHVVVVDGRGLGQYRAATDFTIEDGKFTFTIDEPWDIVPDAGSRVLLTTICEESVYYDNHAENCEKGYWFYGGQMDGIIDGNTGINIEGSLCRSFDIESQCRITPSYFNVHKNNVFEGTAKYGDICNISNDAAYEFKNEEFCIVVYGAEMRGNTLKGALYDASDVKNTETQKLNGLFIGYSSPWVSPTYPCVRAGIIENNNLINMKNGIILGASPTSPQVGNGVNGILVKGNNFTNVKKHILINGTVGNVVQIDQ